MLANVLFQKCVSHLEPFALISTQEVGLRFKIRDDPGYRVCQTSECFEFQDERKRQKCTSVNVTRHEHIAKHNHPTSNPVPRFIRQCCSLTLVFESDDT